MISLIWLKPMLTSCAPRLKVVFELWLKLFFLVNLWLKLLKLCGSELKKHWLKVCARIIFRLQRILICQSICFVIIKGPKNWDYPKKNLIRYKILILVAVERYAYQDLFMKELDLVKLM